MIRSRPRSTNTAPRLITVFTWSRAWSRSRTRSCLSIGGRTWAIPGQLDMTRVSSSKRCRNCPARCWRCRKASSFNVKCRKFSKTARRWVPARLPSTGAMPRHWLTRPCCSKVIQFASAARMLAVGPSRTATRRCTTRRMAVLTSRYSISTKASLASTCTTPSCRKRRYWRSSTAMPLPCLMHW